MVVDEKGIQHVESWKCLSLVQQGLAVSNCYIGHDIERVVFQPLDASRC